MTGRAARGHEWQRVLGDSGCRLRVTDDEVVPRKEEVRRYISKRAGRVDGGHEAQVQLWQEGAE